MRGIKAKAIRKKVYGDMSPRHRTYTSEFKGIQLIHVDRDTVVKVAKYTAHADELRQRYQQEKRRYKVHGEVSISR